MPRPRNPVPSYRLHKSSGLAVVTIPLTDGRRRDVLLGPYDSPESKAEYARVVSEWQTSGGRSAGTATAAGSLSVNDLLLAYLAHAARYYVDPDGNPTAEAVRMRDALKPVRKLYGHTPAAAFGPLALKSVRKAMADADLARTVCNARTNRIRRAWKWAASEELIPFASYQALTTVRGFVRGRGDAKETEPVRPVDPADVDRTTPFMPPAVAAMVRLQLVTGMRPGELCRLRAADIDRTGPVWGYSPKAHKTAYRGRVRTVFIGPQGQAVLAPLLAKAGTGYVFCPRREREERFARMRAGRASPVQPSQVSRKKPQAAKLPGERYTTDSYGQAVATAVEKHNAAHPDAPLAPWRPNRIRHTFATEVRKRFGLEAAGASLGHAKMSVTEIYAEKDLTLALKVAAEAG